MVPDLEPPKVQVESTGRMAAEAAAAAGVLQPQISKPDNTLVKIVGIIAASLTVVSLAALVMFGQADPVGENAAVTQDAAVAQADLDAAEREADQRSAEQHAHELAMQAERAAEQAEYARIEAEHLVAALAAKAEAQSKPKPRTKPRSKPRPKPTPGDDFDDL